MVFSHHFVSIVINFNRAYLIIFVLNQTFSVTLIIYGSATKENSFYALFDMLCLQQAYAIKPNIVLAFYR